MAKAAKQATEVKTLADLRVELDEKQKSLIDHRRHHAAGELANTSVIKAARKEIARLATAIRAAEIEAGKAPKEEK